jgi:hypothetical protein
LDRVKKQGVKREDIRRALLAVLMASIDMRQQAVGAWLYGLIEKSNPVRNGLSAREQLKLGSQYLKDGDILGRFEIDFSDPQFAANCFISRAER